jgi:excisionase family DNA binding protein
MAGDELFNLKQLCEKLGLSEGTVLVRIHNGEIAGAFKIGRAWRIRARDLDVYLDRLRGQSLTEVLRQRESQADFEESVKRADAAGWRDLDAIMAEQVQLAA